MSRGINVSRCMTLTLASVTAMLASCSEKDTTAPVAPVVDPFESPTRLSSLLLTGSAEYGATVSITGGANTITTTADAYTAIWRAEVAVDTALPADARTVTTSLSISAKDAAGNVSAATLVDIIYDPLAGPPTVSVYRINGYYVCQPSGMLTDKADLSDCATRTTPAALFRRGSLVVVTVRATDDIGLTRVDTKRSGPASRAPTTPSSRWHLHSWRRLRRLVQLRHQRLGWTAKRHRRGHRHRRSGHKLACCAPRRYVLPRRRRSRGGRSRLRPNPLQCLGCRRGTGRHGIRRQ